MLILFVTNNYKPYSGGVVSSIDAAADALRAAGHVVYIVTFAFTQNAEQDPYVLRIPCRITYMYKKNHMVAGWRAKKFLEQLFERLKPDVVHVHHPFLLGVAARNVARIQKVPVVFTYHTLYEHYTHYVPFFGALARSFIKKRSFNFCNSVDAVIAPSATIETYVREHAVKKSISVVPSAVQNIFLLEQKNICIKKNNIFSLLTVSRFAKEKNIPFILDVFALLNSEKFSLTLVGYGAYKIFLEHYAYQTLQLPRERVLFIERPEKATLVRLYTQADLFLFASTTETQGLVVCEAMSAGTPVVAVHGPGQQDVICNAENGFLVHTVHEMTQKIQELSENVELQKALCLGALKTAQEFVPSIMSQKLIRVYEQVMI